MGQMGLRHKRKEAYKNSRQANTALSKSGLHSSLLAQMTMQKGLLFFIHNNLDGPDSFYEKKTLYDKIFNHFFGPAFASF